MRKMPVLTIVGLAALLGLVAAPVHAATVVANDTPDLRIAPGATATFDLANFFDAVTGTLTYTAEGGTINGSMVSVFGSATPGRSVAKFTATSGAGSATTESVVQVSSFAIGNKPAVDNNNRIPGLAGGNIFFNALVPGTTVNSAVALTNLPQGGGGGTGGGATGAAALIATIGSVQMTYAETGLRQVARTVVATGAGSASANGLTATLNADGTYSLAAGANFAGTWIVSLGAQSGEGADGANLVAAQATAVAMDATWLAMPAGTAPQGAVAFANGAATFTVAAGQGVLIASTTPVAAGAAGDSVSLVADYNTNNAGVNLALVAFDGALGADTKFTNPSGANLEANVTKNLAISFVTLTGNVVPAVQVFNGSAAAATVTVSNMKVVRAGAVVDYALDPNAVLALGVDGSLASITGWNGNLLADPNTVGPAASTANHFTSAAGAGSMSLPGKGKIANAFIMPTLAKGTNVAECFVQRVGDADAGAAFALVVTDGVATTSHSFVAGASIPTDSWVKVNAVATVANAGMNYVLVQAAGFDANVDDVAIRIVDDKAEYFDAGLLGL
ncbi:MAG: hypothetical protein ACE15F_05790 [bacterium]